MAAGILPHPGTTYGPCENRCLHRDCAATRRDAETLCGICGERIGYGKRFYEERHESGSILTHALCTEIQAEAAS